MVVVRGRLRNVQKSVMHVQSCCLLTKTIAFWRCRCRRRRSFVSSPSLNCDSFRRFAIVFLLESRIADRCSSRHLCRPSVDISVAISVESTLVQSQRIEPRTRIGCYTLSVDSRSRVGRYFADGSPTLIFTYFLVGKFTAMIILHFHLQPQFKNELFHIYFT